MLTAPKAKLCLIQLFSKSKTKAVFRKNIRVRFEKYGRRMKNLTEIDRNS